VNILAAQRVVLDQVFIQGSDAAVDIAVSSPIHVIVRNGVMTNNGNGIVSSGTNVTLTVEDSNISLNGTGIRLVKGTSLALTRSAVTQNTGSGLLVGFGCDVHVDSSSLTFNAFAIDNRGTARISASQVAYNAIAFRTNPVESHGNNAIINNGSAGIGFPRPPVLIGLQ
jgi:hypothetical protein